jgi:hypothetical protein
LAREAMGRMSYGGKYGDLPKCCNQKRSACGAPR